MPTTVTVMTIPDGLVRLRNPANSYEETVDKAGLWCLLFGCFYLAYKGAWMAAAVALGLALATGFISWLVFPFFARRLVVKSYLQRGWHLVDTAATILAQ